MAVIVINEQLCLVTVKNLGIPVSDSFAVKTEDENLVFATKRYDRIIRDSVRTIDGLPVPYRLHQEDIAQALGIPLIGNTDGHIKNFSLLYDENLSDLRLAPAYDLVSTAVYPGHTRNLSMYIGDKNDITQIRRNDFSICQKFILSTYHNFCLYFSIN